MRNKYTKSTLIKKLSVLILFFLFTRPVFSAVNENSWLGRLSGPPTGQPTGPQCKAGSVYYDTTLLKLRKCVNKNGIAWESLLAENIYENFLTFGIELSPDIAFSSLNITSIQGAINRVKGASEEKRTAIIIFPGKYDIGKNPIRCTEYIDLIGVDKTSCTITGSGQTIIETANNSGIISLSIENTNKASGSKAISCINASSFSYLADCNIRSFGPALFCLNSPSFCVSNCTLTSFNTYGLVTEKSNPTIFNSIITGKLSALKNSPGSKTAVFNSTVKGMYISKNSSVEFDNSTTGGAPIQGQKTAEFKITSVDTGSISIAAAISVVQPHTIDYSTIKSKITAKMKPENLPPRSASELSSKPKDCNCKKTGPSIISVDEVYSRLLVKHEKNLVLIDVLSKESYKKNHIVNAINLPGLKLQTLPKNVPFTKELIVYCSDITCGLSKEAANVLFYLGYTNVHNMEGGLAEWTEKHYPVVKGK